MFCIKLIEGEFQNKLCCINMASFKHLNPLFQTLFEELISDMTESTRANAVEISLASR